MPFNIIEEILRAIVEGGLAKVRRHGLSWPPNSTWHSLTLSNTRGTASLVFEIPHEWISTCDEGELVISSGTETGLEVIPVTIVTSEAGAGGGKDVKRQECWFSLDRPRVDPPLFVKPFVDGYVSFLKKAIEVDDFYLERMLPADLVNSAFARRSRLKKPQTAEDWEKAMFFAADERLRTALAE